MLCSLRRPLPLSLTLYQSTEFGSTEQASRGAVSVCDLRVMSMRRVTGPLHPAAWGATRFSALKLGGDTGRVVSRAKEACGLTLRAADALQMAIARRKPAPGLVHHCRGGRGTPPQALSQLAWTH